MWNRRLARQDARRKVRIVLEKKSTESDSSSTESSDDVRVTEAAEPTNLGSTSGQLNESSEVDESETSTHDSTCSSNGDDDELFIESLRNWAISCNVPQSTLRELLKIMQTLRKHGIVLPQDPRTLLKGPDMLVLKRELPTGSYVHFGVYSGLTELIDVLNLQNCELTMDLNIDGVSLFRSSTVGYWVILGAIRDLRNSEFVIGLYRGAKKPNNVEELLEDLVGELRRLEENGVISVENRVTAKLGLICCDRPARSFVKGIKSHNAYFGCDRCTVKGEWHGSVCFLDTNCGRRTNASFRNRYQPEHHSGVSPFQELNSVDMTSDFPVDFMHLICLGVTSRILDYLRSGPNTCRLSSSQIESFDDLLLSMRSCIPSDFSRKPRSIKHLKLWKATELYLFTAYLGFVIMPKLLPISSPVLETCMTYFTVTFIMCSQGHVENFPGLEENVERLLDELFPNTFGKKFCSYNVHAIVHLLEDYHLHGSVHNFGVFRFENFIRFLKKTIRSPLRPLEQTVNRVKESGQFLGRLHSETDAEFELKSPVTVNNEIRYRILSLRKTQLKSKSKDGYVLTKSGKLVKILYFTKDGDRLQFMGRSFLRVSSLFVSPVDSETLCIYKATDFVHHPVRFDVDDIMMKMMVYHDDCYYCLPVLHSYRSS